LIQNYLLQRYIDSIIFAYLPSIIYLTTRYSKFTRSIYLVGDIFLINLAFLLSYFFKFYAVEEVEQDYYIILVLYFNLTWVASAFFLRIYDISRVEENKNIVLNIFKIFLSMYSLLRPLLWPGKAIIIPGSICWLPTLCLLSLSVLAAYLYLLLPDVQAYRL
jgi:hypothetical protein